MKAIILCAGYGSRLGHLTKEKPKCLIEIAGKTIIDHIIERLHKFGIEDIVINLHYMPEKIMSHVGDRALYYYEPKLLGHFGTIRELAGFMHNESFLVLNGDTVSNINLDWMRRTHDLRVEKNIITTAMDEYRSVGAWIYDSPDFGDLRVVPYRQHDLVWFDCGTPQRLLAAQEYYGTPFKTMDRL